MKLHKILIVLFGLALMISSVEAQATPSGSSAGSTRTRLIRFTGGQRSPTVPGPIPPDALGSSNQVSSGLSSCNDDIFRQVYFEDRHVIEGDGFPKNSAVLAIVTPYKPSMESDYLVFWIDSGDFGHIFLDDLSFIRQAGMDPYMTILVDENGYYMGRCANQAAQEYGTADELFAAYYNENGPAKDDWIRPVGTVNNTQVSVEPATSVELNPFLPALQTNAQGVIYAVTYTDGLMWYRHDGWRDGSVQWAANYGLPVGTGWSFKQVFSGGEGVIYGINDNNELMWYRHDGRGDGSMVWASNFGIPVGSGWDFKHVFSGGDGVIYGITSQNELKWYRHNGWRDGTFDWDANSGAVVGTGWAFKQIFSGGDGVIYGITDQNELKWYRHDGRGDGSFNWAANSGAVIGSGWDFLQVFSGGGGVIYAINDNYDMLWYRHDGRNDGSFLWAAETGIVVGTGWTVTEAFSG